MQRFTVTIEGGTWEDVDELELPRLPSKGDLIETKYGTCLVTSADPAPNPGPYAGKIVCRFPSGS